MGIVKLYSDGSSRGNPGPGGYGTVIQYVDRFGELHEKELSQGYVSTTNNRMELLGCIAGFEALNRPCKVEVYSDSKYLVDAFNQKWIESWTANNWKRGKSGKVKNIDLWKRLLAAIEPHEVSFNWVKGHADNPVNERCDRLAVRAAESGRLIEDKNDELTDG